MIKPEDGYIAFIVNPKSGASHSGIQTRPLEKYLASRGFEVRANLTSSLEDACELATEAASLIGLLERDPAVYRRYARWWDQLPEGPTRLLLG